MPFNPKSLDNLRPFTSETAPRNGGRKNFGLSLIEHMNAMAEMSVQAVQAIKENETETIVRRRAAERVLDEKDVWNVVEHSHRRPRTQADVTHHDGVPRTESERAAARDSVLARIRGRISRTS
jgi:hypothetical protein